MTYRATGLELEPPPVGFHWVYKAAGRAHFVCSERLKEDPRWRDAFERWPACRRGDDCSWPHEHETALAGQRPHGINFVYWLPGGEPIGPEHVGRCVSCGAEMEHTDLDDPHDVGLFVLEQLPAR